MLPTTARSVCNRSEILLNVEIFSLYDGSFYQRNFTCHKHRVNLDENAAGGFDCEMNINILIIFHLLNSIFCLAWYLCYMKIMFNYPESSTCWGQHRQARLAYTLALISKLMAPMNISLQSTVFQSLIKNIFMTSNISNSCLVGDDVTIGWTDNILLTFIWSSKRYKCLLSAPSQQHSII